jgi:hypothetical protein
MAWRYGMHYNAAAADLALARGDLSAAKTHVEACRATAHRTRSRRYLVKSQRLLAACHFAAGDFGASEAILAQTVRDATSLGNPTQLWHTALAHGRVLQQLGRRDEAQLAWRTGVESAASAMATLPLDVRVTFASSKLVTALQALTDR